MKRYLAIGILGISLIGFSQAEEVFQKVDVGVGIDIEAGGDYYDDDEEPNYIWIGPGWYGGYWFGGEDDFNEWHNRHGWRDRGGWRGHNEHSRRHDGGHGGHGH